MNRDQTAEANVSPAQAWCQMELALDRVTQAMMTLTAQDGTAGRLVRFSLAVQGAGQVDLEVGAQAPQRTSDSGMMALLLDQEADYLRSLDLVSEHQPAVAGTLPFKLEKVFNYAKTHCAGGNDCQDGSFPLDCTHFICHCLKAAGVQVKNPSFACKSGLCVRVNDLAAALDKATSQYSNVKKVANVRDTRAGDLCFIPAWFGLRKEHVMLLAATASQSGAKVYAHSNERCGVSVDFEGEECSFYRIEEA